MFRKLLMNVAALAIVSLSANMASAQHNPSAKADGDMRPYWSQPHRSASGSNQSYRRFSYAPTVTAVSPTVAGVPMASVNTIHSSSPMVSGPVIQTVPAPAIVASVPNVQSYRRYSYQPSARSRSSHKPAYLYSKADPRRYRN